MKLKNAKTDYIQHFFHKASVTFFLSFIIFLMSGCGSTNSAPSTTNHTHKTEIPPSQSIKANVEAYKKEQEKIRQKFLEANKNASNYDEGYYYDESDAGTYDEGYDKGREDGYYDFGHNPEYENDDYMDGYESGFSEGTLSREEDF